jgi:quercetin dioxygenase-like cupin family protein
VQVVLPEQAIDVDVDDAGSAVARLLSPPDFPLWLRSVELSAGSVMERHGQASDEVVYVVDGQLEVSQRDGSPKVCPSGGAVVVEAGRPVHLAATGAATRVLHFGSHAPGQPGGQPSVHVVGPRGIYAMIDTGRDSHYYADSTCPTCDVTLLYTSRAEGFDSSLHSHSADEIIHVLWGQIRLGRHDLGPGATLAIRHDAPYRFHGGPSGYGFLNYRSGPSTMRIGAKGRELVEGGLVNGFEAVMDVR